MGMFVVSEWLRSELTARRASNLCCCLGPFRECMGRSLPIMLLKLWMQFVAADGAVGYCGGMTPICYVFDRPRYFPLPSTSPVDVLLTVNHVDLLKKGSSNELLSEKLAQLLHICIGWSVRSSRFSICTPSSVLSSAFAL